MRRGRLSGGHWIAIEKRVEGLSVITRGVLATCLL